MGGNYHTMDKRRIPNGEKGKSPVHFFLCAVLPTFCEHIVCKTKEFMLFRQTVCEFIIVCFFLNI